jgi:Flp pilus assembly protein TadD
VAFSTDEFNVSRGASNRRRLRRLLLAAAAIGLLLWCFRGWLAEVPKWQARRALAGRDAAQALRWLERAEHLRPGDGEIEFLRARAYRKQGDLDKDRRHIEKAWELGYSVERLQREQILAQAQAGQLREAEPHLSRLLTDLQGDAAEICEAFVNGYVLNYRFADALRLLESWSSDFPRDPYPHFVRGRILVQLSQWAQAESAFRRSWELQPGNPELACALADALLELNRPEDALSWFEAALPGASTAFEARVGQAKCLRALGRPDEARNALRQLSTADRRRPAAAVALARLELEDGQAGQAIEILEAARSRSPTDPEVRHALAGALRAAGREDEAREHFEWFSEAQVELVRARQLSEEISKKPADIETRLEVAGILLKYGRGEDAVRWLHSVLNLDPGNTAAHRLLADHYAARTEEDAAFAELARRHRSQLTGDDEG